MKKLFLFLLLAFAAILSAEILKKDIFNRHLCGWNSPNYWAGKVSLIEENNKKYFQLVSGTRTNEVFGRALGYSKSSSYFPGETIKVTIKAKGEGNLACGVLSYKYGSGQPHYCRDGQRVLTNQFKTYTFLCSIKERFRMILPFIEIQGKGKVIVESFYWKKLLTKKIILNQ